ncbi:MAG: hypothetical protein JOZ07_02465 [Solirubrobacterales bacterium]|nr:hypothetical protein [Solirubrobacterales bacterium]
MTAIAPPELNEIGLTFIGAAQWLGVSPQTVGQWADDGWFEYNRTRSGRRWITGAQLRGLTGMLQPR